MNKDSKLKIAAVLMILLQCTLYGFGDPISKEAYETVPVFSLLTMRYSVAFIVLMLIFGKKVIETVKTHSVKSWILPCVCISFTYLCNNIALSLTAATSVAFICSMAVVITPLMSLIFFRERPQSVQIVILAFVLVGLYLLCGHGGLNGFGAGEVFALIAAACMAGSLVFAKRTVSSIEPIALTTLQAGVSAVFAFIAALVIGGGIDVSNVTPKITAIILYLGNACTLLGFLLQNSALKSISAGTVATLQCFYPVSTAIWAFVLLGERLSLAGVVGCAIILVCVILAGTIGTKASDV